MIKKKQWLKKLRKERWNENSTSTKQLHNEFEKPYQWMNNLQWIKQNILGNEQLVKMGWTWMKFSSNESIYSRWVKKEVGIDSKQLKIKINYDAQRKHQKL